MGIIKNIINFIKKYIKIIVNFIKNVFDKKKAFLLLGIVSLLGVIFAISSSFAVVVPIESITFTSNDLNYENGKAGAWQVVKSARWISKGKARITYNVSSIRSSSSATNPTDYILVVDGTLRKQGEVLSSAFNNMILNMFVGGNRVAAIGFRDDAGVVTGFSSDPTTIISALNGFLSTSKNYNGNISYYSALLELEDFLKNYTYKRNTNLEIIFVADGKPGIDTPLEVAEYKMLKEKYIDFNISFKAIQYEMGSTAVEEIKNISDEQIIVNKNNVWDVLDSIYFGDDYYYRFILNDKIASSFTIDKASVSIGKVNVASDGSVAWNLASGLIGSGTKATMTIDVSVDNLDSNQLLYVSNNSTSVTYDYYPASETVTTSKTPILASSFSVSYDSNAPKDCVVSNMPDASNVLIYDLVKPSSKIPTCSGYKFKGWKVVTDGVSVNNDGTFTMPYKAVTLKATWAKASLNKTMDGTLSARGTLYGILEKEVTSGGLAKEYTGQHQDDINGTGTSKIYHYYASSTANGTKILDKNNVVFAGICWQMIRTTDTGGVKMIYNGEVSSDGTCGTNRSTHVGYSSVSTVSFSVDALYNFADDYTYNETTGKFSLSGEVIKSYWRSFEISDLIGKYTCFDSSGTNVCSFGTIYQILGSYNSSMAIVGRIQAGINNSVIGSAGGVYDFPMISGVGYMYNDSNVANYDNLNVHYAYIGNEIIGWLATNVSYSGDYYSFSNADISATGVGSYVSPDLSTTSVTSLRYVVGFDGGNYYYVDLTDGNLMDNEYYVVGSDYTVNDDGTYTITSVVELVEKREFFINYASYAGLYFGEDPAVIEHQEDWTIDDYISSELANNKCSKLYINTSTADELTSDNYKEYFSNAVVFANAKFSKEFTYENGRYELTGDSIFVQYKNYDDLSSQVGDYHYTCFNENGVCDSIYYVYYSDYRRLNYLKLVDGNDISTTLDNLFNSSSGNSKDSIFKMVIESWYKKNLISYGDYLEDTVFCNDRAISELGGFDPNSVSGFSTLLFGASNGLSCANVTDRFSYYNNEAKLKYPIGLLTAAEAELLNSNSVRIANNSYWLSTPYGISNSVDISYVTEDGDISNASVNTLKGVRPVITLKGTLRYTTGDGSMNNPYVIETE